jgi:hypothetical protein
MKNKLYSEYLVDGECEYYIYRNFNKISEIFEYFCKNNLLKKSNYVDKDGLQLVVGRDYLAIRKSDDRGIICEVENKNINGITRNIPISCLFNVTAKSDKFIEISNNLKDLISADNLFIKKCRGFKKYKFVKFLLNSQKKEHKEMYDHLKQFLYFLHKELEVKWNF